MRELWDVIESSYYYKQATINYLIYLLKKQNEFFWEHYFFVSTIAGDMNISCI